MQRILLLIALMLLMVACTSTETTEIPDNTPLVPPVLGAITSDNMGQVSQTMILGRGGLHGLAYSPNGEEVAVATSIGLWIYPVNSDEQPRLLPSLMPIKTVIYSPDGQFIATGGDDTLVNIWDVAAGTILQTLTGHQKAVRSLDYSDDGQLLVSADEDAVRIWDVATGEQIQYTRGNVVNVTQIDLSPDATHIAVASTGVLIVLDVLTLDIFFYMPFAGMSQTVGRVAYSPDGQYIAANMGFNGSSALTILDALTGETISTIPIPDSQIAKVAYSPDGQFVAVSLEYDPTVTIWNTQTGEKVQTITQTATIITMDYHPDGQSILIASVDGMVATWDVNTAQQTQTIPNHFDIVDSLAYSPDGRWIVAGYGRGIAVGANKTGSIRLWDGQTGELAKTLMSNGDAIQGVTFSPDGQFIASVGWDNQVRIWDANTGEEIRQLTAHTNVIWDVAYNPAGTRIATASEDGTVRVWDSQTGDSIFVIRMTGNRLAFSPDGMTLAVGADDDTVKFWDMQTGEASISIPKFHQSDVYGVAYSPDGKSLVSASSDGSLMISDFGITAQPLFSHDDAVYAVTFSPDGQFIVSAGKDKTVHLWGKGAEAVLTGHTGWIWDVAVSPDGRFVASASSDGTIRIWGIPNS